jgi:hypothetical protein
MDEYEEVRVWKVKLSGGTVVLLAAFLYLVIYACVARGAPPPQCTLPPRDGAATDDRLAALERRVAELCERLDRPAVQSAPSVAAGLEVQSAPPTAYAAACGPNGCVAGPQPFTNPPPFQGAFYSAGPVAGFQGAGGGCSGGSCGAQAPAGGFLRGGLFRGRR